MIDTSPTATVETPTNTTTEIAAGAARDIAAMQARISTIHATTPTNSSGWQAPKVQAQFAVERQDPDGQWVIVTQGQRSVASQQWAIDQLVRQLAAAFRAKGEVTRVSAAINVRRLPPLFAYQQVECNPRVVRRSRSLSVAESHRRFAA